MIAYHLDRSNSLQEGMCLSLIEPHVPIDASTVNCYGVDKVSSWGNQCCHLLQPNFVSGGVTLDTLHSLQIELFAETIRKKFFPEKPSRFKSIFAVKHLSDFKLWEQYLPINQNSSIFEIEYDPLKCIELDARHLRGGVDCDPIIMSQYSTSYWSGNFSSSPLPELLIPLPVIVGRRVSETELMPHIRLINS